MMQPEYLISCLPPDDYSLFQSPIPAESLKGSQFNPNYDLLSDDGIETESENILDMLSVYAERATDQDDQISQSKTRDDVTSNDP